MKEIQEPAGTIVASNNIPIIKISLMGDIMCEGPLLNAVKAKHYSFKGMLTGIKDLLADSDLIIGNLETPVAGEDKGYSKTKELYSFNAPKQLLQELKETGIQVLLTANNHCYDRGIDGLEKTIDAIVDEGLKFSGTYKKGKNTPLIINLGNEKIAIIACTASTNGTRIKCVPSIENVNLLTKQITSVKEKLGLIPAIKAFIAKRILGEYNVLVIKEKLHVQNKKVSVDNDFDEKIVLPYLKRIDSQIAKARELGANYIILCPHMGGQFNVHPGRFSEFIMHYFTEKHIVDAIIASHPHIVQKFTMINNIPCSYSLGNVSMSLSTKYIVLDQLPDYGIILHLYIYSGKTIKVTCSIIRIEEDEGNWVTVLHMCSKKHISKEEIAKCKLILDRVGISMRGDEIPEEICLFQCIDNQ